MQETHPVKILSLSFLTIVFLYLSFPPIDLGYLAWIAFIPWFILIVTEERYVYLSALFIGATVFFIHLSWLRYVTVGAWVLLSLYCGAYFLLFTCCTRFIIFRLRLPFAIAAPCTWVALEFIRSFFLSGFPWFFIGHTQYQNLPVIQIADITGVYGISFIIIMVNAGITDLIIRYAGYRRIVSSDTLATPIARSSEKGVFRSIRSSQREWFFTEKYFSCLFPTRYSLFFCFICIIPVILITAVLSYGLFRLRDYKPHEGPTVCVVQGNIPQDLKSQPTDEDQVDILKKYTDLSMSMRGKPIDLLVWPETMVPGILNIAPELTGRKIDVLSQLATAQLARDLHTNLLFGAIALTFDGEDQVYFNSAYYYNREGKLLDRYDKIHLVPFGEFTPLKEYFPFLSGLVPYEIGLTHGKKYILFHLETLAKEDFTFGASICYEDTVPSLIREFKRRGADFMLNITNDGWFRNSPELDQHLAIMVFRSVENRMCMVRAANTGISSFVAPDGTIYAKLTGPQGKYREIHGILTNRIKFIQGYCSFYTIYGDYFSIACMIALGSMLFIAALKGTFPLHFINVHRII